MVYLIGKAKNESSITTKAPRVAWIKVVSFGWLQRQLYMIKVKIDCEMTRKRVGLSYCKH